MLVTEYKKTALDDQYQNYFRKGSMKKINMYCKMISV